MGVLYNNHMHDGEAGKAHEKGAVSIFLVIFFALLIGVITMSFVGVVIRDANQSTNNDLSRSAYDSAEAGVEDAKRAIAEYAGAKNGVNAGSLTRIASYFANNCTAFTNFAKDHGVTPAGNDVPVQESGTNGFDQFYTCVQVSLDTPDYVNTESPYQSDVIPIDTVNKGGAQQTPTTIELDWFNHTDAATADGTAFSTRPTCSVNAASGSSCDLPQEKSWDPKGVTTTPSLMRVELISYGSGPITDTALQNNTKTLFLYPTATGAPIVNFNQDVTPAKSNSGAPLIPVKCGGTAEYACSIQLDLGSSASPNMFLRVTPVYKKSTFRLSFTDPNLLFNGVQPLVDSTGRANDLFRRVQARVRMENQIAYPEYAIDSDNSFCKDFSVGSSPSDYVNNCP